MHQYKWCWLSRRFMFAAQLWLKWKASSEEAEGFLWRALHLYIYIIFSKMLSFLSSRVLFVTAMWQSNKSGFNKCTSFFEAYHKLCPRNISQHIHQPSPWYIILAILWVVCTYITLKLKPEVQVSSNSITFSLLPPISMTDLELTSRGKTNHFTESTNHLLRFTVTLYNAPNNRLRIWNRRVGRLYHTVGRLYM